MGVGRHAGMAGWSSYESVMYATGALEILREWRLNLKEAPNQLCAISLSSGNNPSSQGEQCRRAHLQGKPSWAGFLGTMSMMP